MGYLAAHADEEIDDELLRRAMAYGTALASFNVEAFGTERIQTLDARDEIAERVAELAADHALRRARRSPLRADRAVGAQARPSGVASPRWAGRCSTCSSCLKLPIAGRAATSSGGRSSRTPDDGRAPRRRRRRRRGRAPHPRRAAPAPARAAARTATRAPAAAAARRARVTAARPRPRAASRVAVPRRAARRPPSSPTARSAASSRTAGSSSTRGTRRWSSRRRSTCASATRSASSTTTARRRSTCATRRRTSPRRS